MGFFPALSFPAINNFIQSIITNIDSWMVDSIFTASFEILLGSKLQNENVR